jgi:hypothetical protein
MISKSLFLGLLLVSIPVSAQQTAAVSDPPKAEEFDYPTVAAAFAALKTRWDLERISRDDGWIGLSDSRNKIIWAFAPAGHPAYPAVVKRVMIGSGNDVKIKTTAKCEGPKAACDQLLLEFQALDSNAGDYLKFQNRNSSVNILKGAAPLQPDGK